MDAQLEALRNVMNQDEHVFKFLFSNGFNSFTYKFSCMKTDFNEGGKLFMTITTCERNGAGEQMLSIPVNSSESSSTAAGDLDSKFTHKSTGKIGQYETRQNEVIKIELSICMKAMIYYCGFENVIAVQYDRSRDYHIFGPSLQRLVDKVKETNQRLKSACDYSDMALGTKTFLDKVLAALNEYNNAEAGQLLPFTVYYDEEKYKSDFRPPIKEALVAGGRVFDMFCVQGVKVVPATRAVFLDLGIYINHSTNKKVQYRLTTIDEFCMNFALTTKETVIHYHAKPNLSQTVIIGPLYYMGTEQPIESLTTALIGMPCVYISMEEAQQTNFSIKVEPVVGLMVEMDSQKNGQVAYKQSRDAATVACSIYNEIRSSANWNQFVQILSQEDVVRRRAMEYSNYR